MEIIFSIALTLGLLAFIIWCVTDIVRIIKGKKKANNEGQGQESTSEEE